MGSKIEEYCATLGLTGEASLSEVKSAYRREMLKWHPDRHQQTERVQHAQAKAKAINEAFEFLSEIAEDSKIPSPTGPEAKTYNQYRTRHTYRDRTFKPGFPDPAVFEVFVKSSWVISVGYNQQTRTLYLKYEDRRRKGIWRFVDVPRSVFDDLLQADSVGRYVSYCVFGVFRHEAC